MARRYFTETDVRRALKRACTCDADLFRIAAAARMSWQHVAEVREGARSPCPSLCQALGFTPITRYIRTRKGRAA